MGGVTPAQCGFDGLMAEVVVFEEPLQSSECHRVVSYLSDKYLISSESGLASSADIIPSEPTRTELVGKEQVSTMDPAKAVGGEGSPMNAVLTSLQKEAEKQQYQIIEKPQVIPPPVMEQPSTPVPRFPPAVLQPTDPPVAPKRTGDACLGGTDPFAGEQSHHVNSA